MYIYNMDIYTEHDRRRPGHTWEGAAHQHQLGPAAHHRRARDTGTLCCMYTIHVHTIHALCDMYIYENMTVY